MYGMSVVLCEWTRFPTRSLSPYPTVRVCVCRTFGGRISYMVVRNSSTSSGNRVSCMAVHRSFIIDLYEYRTLVRNIIYFTYMYVWQKTYVWILREL